ncbi:MAG TPA: hypothetical protein VHX86_06755 [Tepidisphaeraceae bacterium]|jgi:hypothetical protein|nr:hypothetical protein [Tepidisphaeraceae bacterium]
MKPFFVWVAGLAVLLISGSPLMAGNYQNFAVAVYVPVGVTRQMKDPQWLAEHWKNLSSQLKIDKVYIETYRSRQTADEDSIEPIKKFFLDHGVRVAGGMALVDSDGGQFRSFDYADPKDLQYVQKVTEMTARHFDEIILDDFYFYSTKTDRDIAAKGGRTWTQYRLDTMDDVSENVLMKPARAVNPHVKIIIKFPNWYEHFQGLGYDLDREPRIFDGIYTGTETRDPVYTEQHLQPYQSYSIVRYFNNIAPGRNGGGWVDTFDVKYVDRYAEQLWDTMFAKAPEITLFNWAALERPVAAGDRTLWQDLRTSFDYSRLLANPRQPLDGPEPIMARAAGYSLEQVDAVLGSLGNPIGIQSYRPPHATGEDFLHNFLGMVGIPIDLHPSFPVDGNMLLLTESAKFDPDIVSKIKSQLTAGKSVVITSGLLRALQGKGIEDICELRFTNRKVAVTEFQGPRGRPIGTASLSPGILIPEIDFLTNDAWVLVSGIANGNGYPILLMDHYSKGTLYVLTIPDNFTDLYRLPPEVLGAIKHVILRDFPVILDGPAQISLFAYDNNTFVVESFLPTPADVTVGIAGGFRHLRNVATGQLIEGDPPPPVRFGPTTRSGQPQGPPRFSFTLQIKPHSYEVLSVDGDKADSGR